MKCFHCRKEIKNELDVVIMGPDGDWVCNKQCEEAYKKEKDHFLNVIIHDDKLYNKWLGVTLDA